MKRLLIALLVLVSLTASSQNSKFLISFASSDIAPDMTKVGGQYVYTGTDTSLAAFLSNYTLTVYKKFCENCDWESIAKVYYVETIDSDFAGDFQSAFPSLVERYWDKTDENFELQYYPNDYGTTSPVANTSVFERNDLDYIGAAQAWDVSTGLGVTVGISDGRIKPDDLDFGSKLTFYNYPYSSTAYNPSNYVTYHGTQTAAVIAAQGNNGYGTVGVCPDCKLIATGPDYGYFGNFYDMVLQGARVINMSFTHIYSSPVPYDPEEPLQNLITNLATVHNVVFVASAGNLSSYQTEEDHHCGQSAPYGMKYGYPASFHDVISVSSVQHKYPMTIPLSTSDPSYCCVGLTNGIPIWRFLQDTFSHCTDGSDPYHPLGEILNGWPENCGSYVASPNGIVTQHTANPFVDILAPGFEGVLHYWKFAEENVIEYGGGGTSTAAPYVSGTAALMISVNSCLTSNEVDDILKLTAKDVEHLPVNAPFKQDIGAGKLEVGDAVNFVNQMKSSTGNAVIDHHIYERFDFELYRINNVLTINDVVFRDANTSQFKARTAIDVTDSDFLPNETGFVDIQIDSALTPCSSPSPRKSSIVYEPVRKKPSVVKLFPNPNAGIFQIMLPETIKQKTVNVNIFDMLGTLVYSGTFSKDDISVQASNLPAGVYLVKLSAGDYNDSIKFIRR